MLARNSPPAHVGPHPRRTVGLIVWTGVGLVAVALGVTLVLTTGGPASFGWFAYAPLSSAIFSPFVPLMTQQGQLGLLTSIIGLLILSFAAGWTYGRRRSKYS